VVRAVHREVAAIIRTELSDPEREASTHATIAAFTRKVADLFKADNPTWRLQAPRQRSGSRVGSQVLADDDYSQMGV
jgi:hypothetical protein